MKNKALQFQEKILNWYERYGRKNLPWQQAKTPYRVWISEIMLQQTQVNTVIPYFEQFMQRFPDITALAQAKEDDVMHLWTGLGYYNRARNLLATAKILHHQFNNQMPQTLAELVELPGIGASTAGAILALAFNQPATILDGNVKRVLIRVHGIKEAVNEINTEKKLWELAKSYTPDIRNTEYTQAMMDLGATVCTYRQPQCSSCPLSSTCLAYKHHLVDELPKRKKTSPLPTRETTFLIIKKNQEVLLYKRTAFGVWRGLWSFPEMTGRPAKKEIIIYCQRYFNADKTDFLSLTHFTHTFSHYHLNIYPILITLKKQTCKIMEDSEQIWYNLKNPMKVGLPKPIQLIIQNL